MFAEGEENCSGRTAENRDEKGRREGGRGGKRGGKGEKETLASFTLAWCHHVRFSRDDISGRVSTICSPCRSFLSKGCVADAKSK